MNAQEPTMLGLSEKAHSILANLKEEGQIGEMADGYRLGIAWALALGEPPPEVPSPRKTVFSVATIDPNQELSAAIRGLVDLDGGSVYKMAERLADLGVKALAERCTSGVLDAAALIQQVQSGK